MEKYVKYYIVTLKNGDTSFRKIESNSPFSAAEGKAEIKRNNPSVTKIVNVAKSKATGFLQLSQLTTKP